MGECHANHEHGYRLRSGGELEMAAAAKDYRLVVQTQSQNIQDFCFKEEEEEEEEEEGWRNCHACTIVVRR
eukprot:12374629-Karenia_brevis.AAC.1